MAVRCCCVLACWLGVCGLLPEARAQRPVQAPFRSGTELVLVDVTVLGRDGAPLAGLGPDDFSLSVDGKPRPIQSVRLIAVDGASAPSGTTSGRGSAPPASAGGRTFVLVIDREHIPVGEGQEMLAAAAAFVDRVPPHDRVAVLTTAQATPALRFDESRATLKQRIAAAVGTSRPPLGPWNVTLREALEADDQGLGGTFTWVHKDGTTETFPRSMQPIIARECDRQPTTCPRDVREQVREAARTARQLADNELAVLRQLLESITPVEGPKHIVLVTGGPVMTFEHVGVVKALGAQAALARATIHALQLHDAGPRARTDQMRPSSEPMDQSQSAAFALAGATGGLAVTPVSGAIAFARLGRELSVSYLLAFEAEPGDRDGRPHEIGVTVRDRGWGSSVRARRTFRIDAGAHAMASAAIVRVPAPDTASAAPQPAPPEPPNTPADPTGSPAKPATEPPAPAAVLSADPAVAEAVRKMAEYVAGYGPQASIIVASERYTQQVTLGERYVRPRTLLAEFAIVKADGRVGWTGFRDVVEVDGRSVADRRDRLQSLLTGPPGGESELRRLSDESARYNIGPVARNLNVPTTALFFFHPDIVARFTFRRSGTKTIDGVSTWVLDFRETARPTLVGRRDGTDIPCEGTVWVVPSDGTVVRTRLRLRGFADMQYLRGADRVPAEAGKVRDVGAQPQPPATPPPSPPPSGQQAPPSQPSPATSPGQGFSSSGGSYPVESPAKQQRFGQDLMPDIVHEESLVDIEVTYQRDPAAGLWLPAKMSEVYEGPIPQGTRPPAMGRTVGTARYSDFRRFETAVKIVVPR